MFPPSLELQSAYFKVDRRWTKHGIGVAGRCCRALATQQHQQPSQLTVQTSQALLRTAGRSFAAQTKASSRPRLPVVAAASQNGATADKPKVVVLGTGLMGKPFRLCFRKYAGGRH